MAAHQLAGFGDGQPVAMDSQLALVGRAYGRAGPHQHGGALELKRDGVVRHLFNLGAGRNKKITQAAEHRALDRSEEHTYELQSLMRISYAVFCLKRKKRRRQKRTLDADDT